MIVEKMDLFRENIVINWHEHIYYDEKGDLDIERCDRLVETAYRTDTDKLVCSRPMSGEDVTLEDVRERNDLVYEAMKRHPDMIEGMAFINPGYLRESLYEIDRCINDCGMIGIKMYNQYYVSDPAVRSIIEKCIELDIPILLHAGKLNFMPESQPFISDGTHFAQVAEEYPEAIIIHGHIGGGGDWEWSLKAIKDYPNIFVDTSGSVHDEGLIEKVVKTIGTDRMLFATDGSYSAGIGKILGAKISHEQKVSILNNKRFQRYLGRFD